MYKKAKLTHNIKTYQVQVQLKTGLRNLYWRHLDGLEWSWGLWTLKSPQLIFANRRLLPSLQSNGPIHSRGKIAPRHRCGQLPVLRVRTFLFCCGSNRFGEASTGAAGWLPAEAPRWWFSHRKQRTVSWLGPIFVRCRRPDARLQVGETHSVFLTRAVDLVAWVFRRP